jgi:hypothetical protein
MSYCNQIRKSIDHAERCEIVTFEAAGHLASCPECQSFADERTRLRELLASSGRVTAPINFDAVLNERLRGVKAQRVAWLSPFAYVRLGAATAGIILAVVIAQYSGVLSTTRDVSQPARVASTEGSQTTTAPVPGNPETADSTVQDRDKASLVAINSPVVGNAKQSPKRPRNNRDSSKATDTPAYPVIIIRDQDREFTVPMMTVSVGMQQQVLNSSGRPVTRSLETSY